MVPGMYHCAFGNLFSGLVMAPPPPANDATHDAFVALQQWVEKGVAPGRIVVTKYVQEQPQLGIQMTRPICPYPKVPKYAGTGDANVAANFVCVNSQSTNNPTPSSEYLQ